MVSKRTAVVIGVVVGLGLVVSPGAATHTTGDVELTDGGTYWIGQTGYTDTFDPGDSVQLRRGTPGDDRGFVTQVQVLSDGGVLFDTRRRSADTYYLTDGEGTTLSFDLVRQQYAVDVNPTGATTTISVTSNRRSYSQKVTSPDLSPSQLDTVLGLNGTVVSDGVVVAGSNSQSIPVASSGLAPGSYTVTFHVTDTAASEDVTLTVPKRTEVSLANRIVQGPVGSVVEIPLTFTNTETANVTVGSRDLRWKRTMRVTDTDGDGSVTLRVDTENARQNGTVFSATGGDVSSVTLDVGDQFDRPDRRIAAEAYPISVSTDGTETDVGTMSLTAPSGTMCGKSTGSMVQTYGQNVDEVPGFLSGMLSSATIHGLVTEDANRDYTVVTGPDKRVSRLTIGVPTDASLKIATDCDTVTAIVDANDPVAAFGAAYDNGDITISGIGLIDAVVVELLKLGFRIGQGLGLV